MGWIIYCWSIFRRWPQSELANLRGLYFCRKALLFLCLIDVDFARPMKLPQPMSRKNLKFIYFLDTFQTAKNALELARASLNLGQTSGADIRTMFHTGGRGRTLITAWQAAAGTEPHLSWIAFHTKIVAKALVAHQNFMWGTVPAQHFMARKAHCPHLHVLDLLAFMAKHHAIHSIRIHPSTTE